MNLRAFGSLYPIYQSMITKSLKHPPHPSSPYCELFKNILKKHPFEDISTPTY